MSQAAEPQSQPSSGSKKSKKVKDNKLAGQQQQQQEAIAAAEPAKSTKSSKKNKKKAAEAASAESSRHETAEAAAGEPTTAATGKKLKAKEVKDENNKADKVLNSRKVKETKEENNEADRAFIMSKKASGKEAKDENNEADWKRSISESDKLSEPEKERPAGREHLSSQGNQSFPLGSLANEVAKARLHIKQSLQCMDGIAALAGLSDCNVSPRITSLEKENQGLKNIVQELKTVVTKLDSRVKDLEGKVKSLESAGGSAPALQICPQKPAAKPAEKKEEKKDDDEDVDLFGSDSEGEDEEAAKIREERLAAYAAKKSKKPTLIAKSSLILDVKPWDDETDMGALEAEVRKIQTDGLLWGAAKLVPVAYNIKKLQITCVVEDDKVSIDWLTEEITNIEDYVQSVDIAAFNKI